MTIDLMGALGDAWAMWKRDRDLLLRVAALFLFLPRFALLLILPTPQVPVAKGADQPTLAALADILFGWYAEHGVVLAAAELTALFGALTIFTLYLHPERPDLRGALIGALRLLPRYLLTSILVVISILIGLWLFILPGLYLNGRLLLVGPALVAEQPLGAVAAMQRGVAMTRKNGLVLAGVGCIMVFAGYVLPEPFLALGQALDGAPIANPVSAALLDAGAAAAIAVSALGTILVRIALYKRLASPSRGI
jgi:hypothetical protein